MATFTRSDDLRGAGFVGADLRGADFVGTDLRGARFVGADLGGATLRGVDVLGTEIDSPWLFERDNRLLVNGVDVLPFVDAELDRRFPGRASRHAEDPAGLRAAWSALERAWTATLERVAAMPAGTTDISIDGEWSFAQTLRHLIMATDIWLGRGIRGIEQPCHPIGLLHDDDEALAQGGGASRVGEDGPSYDDVLLVRAERVAMVREFLTTVTAEELAQQRRNPHSEDHPETVLSCLHTILEEEWEHLRYAVRDLDAIRSGGRA